MFIIYYLSNKINYKIIKFYRLQISNYYSCSKLTNSKYKFLITH